MNMRFQIALTLAAAFIPLGVCAQQPTATPGPKPTVPPNIVTEGIPAISDALRKEAGHYLTLGGADFRGWHTVQRELLVTTRLVDSLQLHTVNGPMAKRIALTHFTEPVTSGWFQPRTGELFVFSSDKGGNEQYQLYALAVNDRNAAPVLLTDGQSRNTGVCWSHDGQWLAYASTRRNNKDNDIYLVNPSDPKTTRCLLVNASPGWSAADWSRDDSHLLLRRGINETKAELWSVDVKSGEKKLLTKAGEEIIYDHARFGDGGAAIYAETNDGSDFLTLTRLDVATGKREALSGHILWDVEDFEISGDGKTLAFVANEDGFGRLHLLDLSTRKELPVPKLPGDVVSNLSWHPLRRELGFTLNGSQTPNDAYSLEVDTGTLTRWTDRTRKPGATEHFSEPELVRVKSFDGVPISALVYRPDPQKFPGRRPVVINIHGGPSSQSRPGFRGTSNYYLNELGVALVFPNVRGSLGYGRKFVDLDNGMHREDAVHDIGSIIDWIQHDPALDGGRIAVMGGSYGGFMTLACMVRYHDVLRCGVDSVGIGNFVTFLHDTSDYRRGNRREEYGDERQPAMQAFLERISPANHASEIKSPLLIVQGKNDPRVPMTEAEHMRDAIRASGGKVWYLMATDEGHGFKKTGNAQYQFFATITFLREFLLK
ncbi:MAG: prolyl oligopeptidase family serine peptidase [Chthoniobacter sp.]|uniref:S9 family peptidase n=1 Tax=Chthoniobacter sp. TaxID=2510640 RepID=UPI0032A87548